MIDQHLRPRATLALWAPACYAGSLSSFMVLLYFTLSPRHWPTKRAFPRSRPVQTAYRQTWWTRSFLPVQVELSIAVTRIGGAVRSLASCLQTVGPFADLPSPGGESLRANGSVNGGPPGTPFARKNETREDVVRAALSADERRQGQEVGESRDRAARQVAAT
jgi:hypothetical protein